MTLNLAAIELKGLISRLTCVMWAVDFVFRQQFQNCLLKFQKFYVVETMIKHVTILNLLGIP